MRSRAASLLVLTLILHPPTLDTKQFDRDEIRRNITAIMDSLGSLKLRFDEVNEQNGRNSIKIMDIGDTADDAEKKNVQNRTRH